MNNHEEKIEETHYSECDLCKMNKVHFYDGYIHNLTETFSEYYLCRECHALYDELRKSFHRTIFSNNVKFVKTLTEFLDVYNSKENQ